MIHVDASRIASFGESRDSTFCLVTTPDLADDFRVDPGPRYAAAKVVPYDGRVDFASVLGTEIPENAHVLVVLPTVYFRSPSPAELGPRRKLGVMACASTPTSPEAIQHFVRIAEQTDPAEQERMADEFFVRGEAAGVLRFVDETYGTVAEFAHLGDDLQWHEQCGYLDWGQQQLMPAGEISVLPVQVFGQDIDTRFAMNGELALRGVPILHSGTPSFLPADQERLFRSLASMGDAAVIATVRDGVVTGVEATSAQSAPAARALTALGEVDSRFRSVLEVGFGVNTKVDLFPGNSAMNEVYGGLHGAVHFGFGLIPYTQYHLDVVCPGTRVLGGDGEPVFAATARTPVAAG